MMEKVVKWLSNLPTLLRQWRVIKISLISYLCFILYKVVMWMTVGPFGDLTGPVQSIVISSLVLALIAGIFKVVDKIDSPIDKDRLDNDDVS